MSPVIEDKTYCNYQQNQYYDRQGEICKMCDKCPKGWELEPIENSSFEINPVHGALGCRQCVRCRNGFFSDSFSYDSCKPCRNCTAERRNETEKCTKSRNTVCGKPISQLSQRHPSSNATDGHFTWPLILSMCLGTLLIIILVLVAVHLCLKYKRSRAKKDNPNNSECQEGLISPSTSNFSSKDTLETDSGSENGSEKKFHDKIKMLKESHLAEAEFSELNARKFSKNIATKFKDIGISLGLTDNDIQIIIADNPRNIEEQSYQILIKWKQLRASEATVLKLLDTLLSLRLNNIAENLCDIIM